MSTGIRQGTRQPVDFGAHHVPGRPGTARGPAAGRGGPGQSVVDIHPLRRDPEFLQTVALRGQVLAGGRDPGVEVMVRLSRVMILGRAVVSFLKEDRALRCGGLSSDPRCQSPLSMAVMV